MKKIFLTILTLFVSICFLTACKKSNKVTTTQTEEKTTTKIDLDGHTLIWCKEDYPDLQEGLIDYYASEKGHWVLEVGDNYWCEIQLNDFSDNQKTTCFDSENYLYTIAQSAGVYLRATNGLRITKAYYRA